jgi:hypothetical protein
MSVGRQELYLLSLVHGINWLRSVVNVYHDQVRMLTACVVVYCCGHAPACMLRRVHLWHGFFWLSGGPVIPDEAVCAPPVARAVCRAQLTSSARLCAD